MRTAPMSWTALTAWGSGLVQIAIGAGMLRGEDAAAHAVGILLLLLGTAALAWGAAVLVRGRTVTPRTVVTGALVGIVTVGAALAIDSAHVSPLAAGAAALLATATGAGVTAGSRRRVTPRRGAAPAAAFVAAIIVAAIVTPALGATEAGRLAPDHSSHDLVFDEHQH